MKISTKGKYGIKAMLDLALYHDEGTIPLKDISERQGISEPYLEQIISTLKKAGLVSSIRGVQGGYQLAKSPEQINVSTILIVMEGPLLPFDGENPGSLEEIVLEGLWSKARETVEVLFNAKTLADLVQDVRRLRDKNEPMWYI